MVPGSLPQKEAKIMSARTVITHAPNQGEESARILSLRAALTEATAARRAAEAAVRDHIPGARDAYAVADRVEMDAYLALFDARRAPVGGVSLGKVSDGVPVAERLCADVLRGCAHSAVMDDSGYQVACGGVWVRSSWTLRGNDLDSLADWFAASPGV